MGNVTIIYRLKIDKKDKYFYDRDGLYIPHVGDVITIAAHGAYTVESVARTMYTYEDHVTNVSFDVILEKESMENID